MFIKRIKKFLLLTVAFCFAALSFCGLNTAKRNAWAVELEDLSFGDSPIIESTWSWDGNNTLTLTNDGSVGTLHLPNKNIRIVISSGVEYTIEQLIDSDNYRKTLTISGSGTLNSYQIDIGSWNLVISGGNIVVEGNIICGLISIGSGIECSIDGNLVQNENVTTDLLENATRVEFAPTDAPEPEPHEHSFSYSANGATLTATCANGDGGCGLDSNQISTTLSVSNKTYDGTAVVPSLSDLSDFTTATGLALNDFTFNYYTSNDEPLGSAPTDVGSYYVTATVDADGNKTLTASFAISKATYGVGEGTTAKAAQSTTYNASTYDLSQLFNIDASATNTTYALTGGTGAGTINGNLLTITRCGTFNIGLTAEYANYETQVVSNTLTVNKANRSNFSVNIDDSDLSGAASIPSVDGTEENASVTYLYYTDSLCSIPTENAGAYPTVVGQFYVKATIAESDNYNQATATDSFIVWGQQVITSSNNGSTFTVPYGVIYNDGYDVSSMFDFDENAGAASYEILSGTGATLQSSTLTLTQPVVQDYQIQVTTQDGGFYKGTSLTLTLSVQKDNLTLQATIADWTYGETASELQLTGNTYNGTVTLSYYTDSGRTEPVTENNGVPVQVGTYYYTVEVAATEFSNAASVNGTVSIVLASATIAGEDVEITYAGTLYDVSQMFTPGANAGAATYSIVPGGTGNGELVGSTLRITCAGTIQIKIQTAATATMAAGEKVNTLTVSKGTYTNFVVTMTDGIYLGSSGVISIPGYSNNALVSSLIQYCFYVDENLTQKTFAGEANEGDYPDLLGVFYLKAWIPENDLYNGEVSSSCSFTNWIVPTIDNSEEYEISFIDLTGNTFDVSTLFDISGDAGEATYNLLTVTQNASLSGSVLTILATGEYQIQVSTAQDNNNFVKGVQSEVLLRIVKVELDENVDVILSNWEEGQPASTPEVVGDIYCSVQEIVIEFYSDDEYQNKLNATPTDFGDYYIKITIPETVFSEEKIIYKMVSIVHKRIVIDWCENNFVYNGRLQTITASYKNESGQDIPLAVTTDRMFFNAGTYTATVAFANGETNYSLPDQKTRQYSIAKRYLTVELHEISVMFDPDMNIDQILNNPDNYTISSGSIIPYEEPFTLYTDAQNEVAVGRFSILGECTSVNYEITFMNGSNAFTINNAVVDFNVDSWVYGDSPVVPTFVVGTGDPVISYKLKTDTNYSADLPEEPGEYVVRVKVESEYDYIALEEFFEFEIDKISVVSPERDSRTFVYNGNEQTYYIIENNELFLVSGNTETNAGEYKVSLTLVDTAHKKWAETGTSLLQYDFVIDKQAVPIPAENTRIFRYTGTAQTYLLEQDSRYTISNNTTQTEIGAYNIVVALINQNYKWSDGTTADKIYRFAIRSSNLETAETTDANGNKLNSNPVVIVSSENGIDPELKLSVKVIGENSKNIMENVKSTLKKELSNVDKIFKVYDVSLIKDNAQVQPDGSITLKIAVPEELRNSNFKLFHIHTDANGRKIVTQIDYGGIDENGNIFVQMDGLSELAFVSEQTSIMWLVIALAAVCGLLSILLVLQILLFNKKKNAAKMAAAAPIFLIQSEIILLVVLGVVAVALIVSNIVVFVKHKKQK